MSIGGLAALGGGTVGKLGLSVYERWLLLRSFLVGLRIAWVSAASAAIGLVLFFIAAPAQDILLEVNYDGLWINLSSWIGFYGLVIFFWALPVVVSARWILARFAAERDRHPHVEPIPDWIRGLIPAVLAALCFLAVLTGQLGALQVSPPFSENAPKFISDAAKSLRSGEQLRACTRKLDGAGCARLTRDVAVVVGSTMLRRNNVPLLALGVCLLLGLWFFLARPAVLARLVPPEALRKGVMALATSATVAAGYVLAALAVASALPNAPPRMLLLTPLALVLAAIAWLAWMGWTRLLWWLGTVIGIAGALVMALAVYGAVEIERQGRLGLAHLYLLPFVTAAAAAFALWVLGRRSSGQATRLGLVLLRVTGEKDGHSEEKVTRRIVNPIFYGLVCITVALNAVFVLVSPAELTEGWHINRSSLLPIVLGLPVAVFTWLSYASARSRVPLIPTVLVLLGLWHVAWDLFGRDYYEVRTVALSEPRPLLNAAVDRWAKANDCRLPKRPGGVLKEDAQKAVCPPPIIVAAAGGASRAAFHLAGVLGKLLDDERAAVLMGHEDIVYSTAFNHDGSLIATGSEDTTVGIWDSKRGRLLSRLEAHKKRVQSVAFSGASSERRLMVTASWDKTARVWDVSDPKAVKMLAVLQHPQDVNSAAFSPDGKLVITGSDDGHGRIWRWEEPEPRAVELGTAHRYFVYGAAFSPDGKLVVTASWDRTAKVWDVSSLDAIKELRTLQHPSDVNSAAFSPDGKLIVTGSDDGKARIWEWASDPPRARELPAHEGIVFGVAFSPNGRLVVSAAWDKTAKVWDVSSLDNIELRYTLTEHDRDVNSAAFSADGKRLVTASDDKTARLWDVASGRPVQLEDSNEAFRPLGKQLFAISAVSGGALGAAVSYAAFADSQLGTGDVKNPPCNEQAPKDRDWYTAADERLEPEKDPRTSWKACLQLLVSGDFLSPVVLGLTRDPFPLRRENRAELLEKAWEARYHWYTRKKQPEAAAERAAPGDGTLAKALVAIRLDIAKVEKGWLPILLLNGTSVEDGKRIVTSDIDMSVLVPGAVKRVLYDAHDFHKLLADLGHNAPVYSVATGPRGARIVTASNDGTARIWDLGTGNLMLEAAGHDRRVQSASFSPDGNWMVTASWDKTAKLWDLSDPDRFKRPRVLDHESNVNGAAFSPDGRWVATVSVDRSIRIWEVATGARLAIRRPAHRKLVYGVAFSPDGKRLVSASWDGTAKIWDVASAGKIEELRTLPHGSDVNSAEFSRDGKRIVTAADDGKARLWDAETGNKLAELSGHENRKVVYGASFNPDGKRVVTSSWDGTAKVWDVSSPGEVKVLHTLRHGTDVNSAVFTPDGKRIVTAADDGRVRIWNAETGERIWLKCANCDVGLSTGVTMSARFPVISPSGTFVDGKRKTRSVVDGAYYENFGATTAMELARALKDHWGLDPMVVLVNNDHEVTGLECVSHRHATDVTSSWLWSPLNTVIATRTARGSHAAVSLCEELAKVRRQTEPSRFAFITVNADKTNEHMTLSVSWWMSKNVQSYLDRQLGDPINKEAFAAIERVRVRPPTEKARLQPSPPRPPPAPTAPVSVLGGREPGQQEKAPVQ
jgi:WD40 repeat protein